MKHSTFVIWEGQSLLDGQPIVVLAQTGSRNSKTGSMIQTFILHSILDPITASRTGADSAICGDCPHRGQAHDGDSGQAKNRTCYVTLAHAPLGKFKAFRKGMYPDATTSPERAAIGAGRMVRVGTYGDPAAVPQAVWDDLLSESEGWTAYTHNPTNPSPSQFMTSADSESQAVAAWGRGERTFRVVADLADIVRGKEVLCPASKEAGARVQCESCKLCGGTSVRGKSVAIVAHGNNARKAKQLVWQDTELPLIKPDTL